MVEARLDAILDPLALERLVQPFGYLDKVI